MWIHWLISSTNKYWVRISSRDKIPWEKVKLLRIKDIKMDWLLIKELEMREMESGARLYGGSNLELSIGSIPPTFHSREWFLSEARDKTFGSKFTQNYHILYVTFSSFSRHITVPTHIFTIFCSYVFSNAFTIL